MRAPWPRRGVRAAEGDRLENGCGPKDHRGFESHPLRQRSQRAPRLKATATSRGAAHAGAIMKKLAAIVGALVAALLGLLVVTFALHGRSGSGPTAGEVVARAQVSRIMRIAQVGPDTTLHLSTVQHEAPLAPSASPDSNVEMWVPLDSGGIAHTLYSQTTRRPRPHREPCRARRRHQRRHRRQKHGVHGVGRATHLRDLVVATRRAARPDAGRRKRARDAERRCTEHRSSSSLTAVRPAGWRHGRSACTSMPARTSSSGRRTWTPTGGSRSHRTRWSSRLSRGTRRPALEAHARPPCPARGRGLSFRCT